MCRYILLNGPEDENDAVEITEKAIAAQGQKTEQMAFLSASTSINNR